MPTRISHDSVHQQLDPLFFLDYALFSGTLRHYTTKCLEDAFHEDPNDAHRRFFVLGVFREEHAAYEDLGAILESFIRVHKKEVKFGIENLLRFKDDKVELETLFKRRNIRSAQELFDALNLDSFIPATWSLAYPSIDCRRAFIRICTFFFEDCAKNQQRQGVSAYNKIKHGLLLVPNAKSYDTSMPDAPGVIIQNPDQKSPNPYALLALPMSNAALDERCKLVEFVQSSVRALVALYLITHYPAETSARARSSSPLSLFDLPPLLAVREFIEQLANKPSTAAPAA